MNALIIEMSFSLQCWFPLSWDDYLCPDAVENIFEGAYPCLCCPFLIGKVGIFSQDVHFQARFELFVLEGAKG